MAEHDQTRPYGDSRPIQLTPHTVPALAPGELVDGTYRVLGQLGAGAMGTVFHALDEPLDREVALKLVTTDQMGSTEAIDRFRSEARAMARIRHPNVVEIYALGTHQGMPYIAMEMIRGPNLAQWHVRNAPLSIDTAVGILAQLAAGVGAIHDAGAVHRDLKPSNMVIGPAGRIVVADLGLARVQGQPDQYASSTIAGTPAYMAPELTRTEPVDEHQEYRADVYSLGVIAFELLTGQRPFVADDPHAMLQQHALCTPPLPSSLRRDLPSVFDPPIMTAMAKEPTDRTPSAHEFRRMLLSAYEQTKRTRSSLRILVADDDFGSLQATVAVLEDAFPGAQVISARDGNAALAAAMQAQPDVVVTDLRMPGRDGMELTAALRSRRGVPRVPIVVITGDASTSDWRRLQRLGADQFLVKPVDANLLVSAVRSVTERRSDRPAGAGPNRAWFRE